MPEKSSNCEEGCAFFSVLSPRLKSENQLARQATWEGKEFPGSLNTLCGICVKEKIIDASLEEKSKELLKVK